MKRWIVLTTALLLIASVSVGLAGCGAGTTTTQTVTTTVVVTPTPTTTTTATTTTTNTNPATTNYVAALAGGEEVPPVTTAAQGEATFSLSADRATLTYKVTVSNINDVFASHIHMAEAGVNGPVVVGLFAGTKEGRFDGVLAEGTITAANLQGLLAGMTMGDLITAIEAGNTYVNVHTNANRGGEIRGQIQLAP